MEHELKCSICLNFFEEPVVLSCGHHVCHSHVDDIIRAGREHGECPVAEPAITDHEPEITCPICRAKTSVQSPEQIPIDKTLRNIVDHWKKYTDRSGVICSRCSKEKAVKECKDCSSFLCETCQEDTHSGEFYRGHELSAIGPGALFRNMHCPTHKERLNLYCRDCRHPVCAHCLLVGQHVEHERTSLREAHTEGMDALDVLLTDVGKYQGHLTCFVDSLDDLQSHLAEEAAQQQDIVRQEISKLRAALLVKEKHMLSDISKEMERRVDSLQQQISEEKTKVESLEGVVTRGKKLKQMEDPCGFMFFFDSVAADLRASVSAIYEDKLVPRESDKFTPVSTASARDLIDAIGFAPPPLEPPAAVPNPTLPSTTVIPRSRFERTDDGFPLHGILQGHGPPPCRAEIPVPVPHHPDSYTQHAYMQGLNNGSWGFPSTYCAPGPQMPMMPPSPRSFCPVPLMQSFHSTVPSLPHPPHPHDVYLVHGAMDHQSAMGRFMFHEGG